MGAARLVLQYRRHRARHVVGVRGAGVGRLLGVGSSRERVAAAVAGEHGVPALDHGAGETRDAAQVERHASGLGVSAGDFRHVHNTQRCHLERPLLCAVAGGEVVRRVFDSRDCGNCLSRLDSPQRFAVARRAGEHGQSRGGVPLQQSGAGRNRVFGSVGDAVSDNLRSGARKQDHGRSAVLQHRQYSARAAAVAVDGYRAIDRVAPGVGGESQAAVPGADGVRRNGRDSLLRARGARPGGATLVFIRRAGAGDDRPGVLQGRQCAAPDVRRIAVDSPATADRAQSAALRRVHRARRSGSGVRCLCRSGVQA